MGAAGKSKKKDQLRAVAADGQEKADKWWRTETGGVLLVIKAGD